MYTDWSIICEKEKEPRRKALALLTGQIVIVRVSARIRNGNVPEGGHSRFDLEKEWKSANPRLRANSLPHMQSSDR